jgi:hypothetical protein
MMILAKKGEGGCFTAFISSIVVIANPGISQDEATSQLFFSTIVVFSLNLCSIIKKLKFDE